MKWYKHISDSLDDPFIAVLMRKFGSDGYLVFFGTLEVMAREFDVENPGKCEIDAGFLKKKLHISMRKLQLILNFCTEKQRIYAEFKNDDVLLNCPKLKELCDEYTTKLIKKIGTKSGVTPKNIRVEVEGEVDIKKNKKKEPPFNASKNFNDRFTQDGQQTEKDAIEVIRFLNTMHEKNYPESHIGTSPIKKRIESGATLSECKQIIITKSYDPYFQNNRNLMAPKTLFGDKFETYLYESAADWGGDAKATEICTVMMDAIGEDQTETREQPLNIIGPDFQSPTPDWLK